VSNWDLYWLGKHAANAEAGWAFVDIGIPGVRILVHPDIDCTHSDCPQAGESHRHQPTEADREVMDRYITRWLTAKHAAEEYIAGRQKDIAELERTFRLECG
jgi:hypothetical protein